MTRIVMKFGGTSAANPANLRICAQRVAEEVAKGHQVAVAVSAPAGMTDDLTGRIAEFDQQNKSLDEADLILSAGEQINAGLMAMALRELGLEARSWTGWQAGFITDDNHGQARIRAAETHALCASLDAGQIAVLTGFQGVTKAGRVTTFGRGGTDLSAVALAHAIGAERCDIYTDVTGVFTADPRIVPTAKHIASLTPIEMLEMASNGAKVLHTRSVELALGKDVSLRVLSTFTPGPGTQIKLDENAEGLESNPVNGVTYSRDQSRIALFGLQSGPQIATMLFSALAQNRITVDMMMQSPAQQKDHVNLVFATSRADHQPACMLLRQPKFSNLYDRLDAVRRMAKVSVIGLGLRSQQGMAHTFFAALSAADILMDAVATSEIRISVLIADADVERAVQALHFAFGLDRAAR
ncbi:MAG: aspartate kinase [Robiginitomaculum sp.]|nr:aspartate kinase [Robiginitomaculum sp.]